MKKESTVSAVWPLAENLAESLGLSLWDVRFVKEGANYILRLFIDKEGGVALEDCEAMSRAIDKPLDELDPIEQAYTLEVSSPGLERELSRPEHFVKLKGETIVIKLYKAVDNNREIMGVLEDVTAEGIGIVTKEGLRRIPEKEAASVRQYYDFGGTRENE